MTASYGTSCISSFVILMLGIVWYWRAVEPFNTYLFSIGILGSILDTVGKSCIQNAYSKGPAGPVAAFVEMNNVLLIIAEAFRTWMIPSSFEIVGFVLGITGGLAFVFPDKLHKFKDSVKTCCGCK